MPKRHLAVLAFLLFINVFSVVAVFRETGVVRALATSNDQLRSSLAGTRSEMQELSAKLRTLTAASQSPSNVVQEFAPAHHGPAPTAPASVTRPAEDRRLKQLRSQLADQREQITRTQKDLQRTSREIDGKLRSAQDELKGSIAKTHDDVVSLRRRGERNYYEFRVSRSKQFQHVGPLSISLRKADTNRRYYDLAMMVNDDVLEKKHVNLYEPILVNLPQRPQPVQLVVNGIHKDEIRGYVSEPKYKGAEVASSPAAVAEPTLKNR